jgi:hypothetical protein
MLKSTQAAAPTEEEIKFRDKYHLKNSRYGILDLPHIAVLTGEQHQRYQGTAHQQQERGQKLNIMVGSSLNKGPGSREWHGDPHTRSRRAERTEY